MKEGGRAREWRRQRRGAQPYGPDEGAMARGEGAIRQRGYVLAAIGDDIKVEGTASTHSDSLQLAIGGSK